MKTKLKFIRIVTSAIIIFSMISGCGSSSTPDKLQTNENQPESTDIVPANDVEPESETVVYEVVENIDLYVKNNQTGDFEIVTDGSYLPPDVYTVGIGLSYLGDGNEDVDLKVFISDGDFFIKTEALKNESSGYYECDFEFTTKFLIFPIFIQVIYPDGLEITEKMVVNTSPHIRPDSNMLVENGMGITVGNDILSGFSDLLEDMFKDMLKFKVVVDEFGSADNSKGDNGGVFHLSIKNILDGDMIIDSGRGDKRELNIEFEDLSLIWKSAFGKLMGDFIGPLLNFSMGSIGFDLGEMISGLGNDGNEEDKAVSDLISSLDIDKTLLFNIQGLPEYTTTEFAALGGGIFACDTDDLEYDKKGKPIWPDVYMDDFLPELDLKRLTGNEDYNVNLALSQYNVNQILSDMVSNMAVIMDESSVDLSFITPENPGDEMELKITVNPLGIAIDFNYQTSPPVALINLNDLRVVLLEDGNEKTEISADLTLEVDFGIRSDDSGYFLEFGIVPIEKLSHVNVIKDTKGLNILEHAKIVKAIFGSFSEGGDEADPAAKPRIPINLGDMGLIPNTKLAENGEIIFDGNGNCFLSLALDSIDPAALLGDDACFISTTFF